MSDELTPRRTLESLKKEAKRWLAAIARGDANAIARLRHVIPAIGDTPTLRDIQLAIAREHGFAGWTELKLRLESSETEVRRGLASFDDEVNALLDAYRLGTPEAMKRHWSFTWHRRAWQGMRTYVQLDLGRQAGTPGFDDGITIDDARYLVAREHGFADWAALTQALRRQAGTTSPDPRLSPSGRVTDDRLATMPLEELTELDLSGSAVTDRGLEHLRRARRLEQLNLASTAVTDEGIVALRDCTMLRRLDLSWTATGDGALTALAGHERLAFFTSGQLLTDAGLALLRMLPVFTRWRPGEGEIVMTDDASPVNQLVLRGRFTESGLRHLQGLDGLAGLNLDAMGPGISPRAISELGTLPHLEWLALDARDETMPAVAALPHLRYFSCQDTVASDDGFEALARSRTIEVIWGRDCHNLRDRGFAALSRMPALRKLSVSCLKVSDDALALLPDFPALVELMPMGVPDEGYRHIARCAGLESLVLMYCREAGDRSTEHITRLPRLRKYFASYNRITDRTPQLLATMPTLEEVTFSACAGITDEGVAALAALPRLRTLRVSGRHVTPRVAERFGPQVNVEYSL